MRQAGRYMSEYRALRERYSLLDICRTPDLATEVGKLYEQDIRQFGYQYSQPRIKIKPARAA